MNALRIQKLWIFSRDMSRCRANRGSCSFGLLPADAICLH